MRIEIIFDAICPWCYIGKRRLEQALVQRPHLRVTAEWRPFLLNPEMPVEGIQRDTYLQRKFGNGERIRRIFWALGDAGKSVDIDFAFDRIGRTPSTVNSHRLVRFAARHGRADAAVEALFLDYFVNGRNIGDNDVLTTLGGRLGLDAEALATYLAGEDDITWVFEENARAHRLGINGVPSYVFDGRMVICGAQEPPVLERIIDAARELEAAG